MSPTESYYAAHAEELKATERARRQAQAKRVSEDELERLRLPQFRLETLDYGADHQLVCLWCGYLANRALARHVSACPKMPLAVKAKLQERPKARASDVYKEQWGYNRSNPLMSEEERANRKASRKSERFRQAFAERVAPTFAAKRAEQTAARQNGGKPKRGSMRLESRLKRTGQRLPARPNRQKVSDADILEIVALDLPLERMVEKLENKKHVRLSQTALYRRAQRLGWDGKVVKAKRRVVNQYVFRLRGWLWTEPELPDWRCIIAWHADGLRSTDANVFRDFTPYLSHLEATLRAEPHLLRRLASKESVTSEGTHGATLYVASAAITLASRVFARSRARIAAGGRKSLPEEDKALFATGKAVQDVIPDFERAFELVRALPRAHRKNRAKVQLALKGGGFSQDHIQSVLFTSRPSAAARYFIAEKSHRSLGNVTKAHQFYCRTAEKRAQK